MRNQTKETQYFGLNARARSIINGLVMQVVALKKSDNSIFVSVAATRLYQVERVHSERYYADLRGQRHVLYDYVFPNGTVFHEEMQLAPCHSGMAFCLALRDEDGKWIAESLWSPKAVGSNTRLPSAEWVRSLTERS